MRRLLAVVTAVLLAPAWAACSHSSSSLGAHTSTAAVRDRSAEVVDPCVADVRTFGAALVSAMLQQDQAAFSNITNQLIQQEGTEGPASQVLLRSDTLGLAVSRALRNGTSASESFLAAESRSRCAAVLAGTTPTTTATTSLAPSVTGAQGSRSCRTKATRSDGGPGLGPEDAAKCLYDTWRDGDRAGASYFASPSAVDTLFKETWKPPGGIFEGCLSKTDPTTQGTITRCSFAFGEVSLTMLLDGGPSLGFTVSSIQRG